VAASKRRSAVTSDLDTVSWWDDFYAVVRRIPRGRVTTYGAVALLAGHPRAARHVGWAMAALKDIPKHRGIPWQRVLGAASKIRARVTIKDPVGGGLQRAMLEGEGVVFDAHDRVDLTRFGWSGVVKKAPVKGARRPRPPAPGKRSPPRTAPAGGASGKRSGSRRAR
jgi:methylated-DNA-protein-cysteine methyltransferase-like protein